MWSCVRGGCAQDSGVLERATETCGGSDHAIGPSAAWRMLGAWCRAQPCDLHGTGFVQVRIPLLGEQESVLRLGAFIRLPWSGSVAMQCERCHRSLEYRSAAI